MDDWVVDHADEENIFFLEAELAKSGLESATVGGGLSIGVRSVIELQRGIFAFGLERFLYEGGKILDITAVHGVVPGLLSDGRLVAVISE